MDLLPNEIILIVFGYIQKVTDKRQFLRTCILYNKITKQSLVNFENDMYNIYFHKLYDAHRDVLIPFNFDGVFKQFKHTINKLCPEKFMIELSHDGYPDLINKSCLNVVDNVLLIIIFASYGNVELLEYVINEDTETKLISSYGARNGHISVIEFCKDKGYTIGLQVCSRAANNGHINVLKWYIENGYVWHEHSSTFAAYYGHVEVIRWIIDSGLKLHPQIIGSVAIYGHINILELWAEKNYLFNISTCQNAAYGGQLNALKWLKQNKYPCDAEECISSALKGIINTNQWAIEYGNQPESQDYINKILQTQNDVIRWAQNGCLI